MGVSRGDCRAGLRQGGVFASYGDFSGGGSPLSPSVIFSQIQSGLTGLYLQAAIVPLIVIALRVVLCGGKDHD